MSTWDLSPETAYRVGLVEVVGRRRHEVNQRPVVGEEDQAFGVEVQPPDRHHARSRGHELYAVGLLVATLESWKGRRHEV